MKGLIVYRDYEEISEKGYIILYGRLENGESFVSMHEFKPYFFVKEEEIKTIQKIDKKKEIVHEKTKLKTFQNEKVIKLIFKNQKHLLESEKEIKNLGIEIFEGDIKPSTRFMLDKNLFCYIEIDGKYSKKGRTGRFYEFPEIKPSEGNMKPKILSIDLESGKENGKLFCIGLYSEGIEEILMITSEKIEGVVPCKDEKECLEKFKQRILEIDPDIITGWNIIDFDFVFLEKLFKKNKISFDIGRNEQSPRMRIEKSFLKKSSMDIPGRVVLDGLNMIRDPFIKEAPTIKNIKFESYALEEVAEQIIKKTKLIKGSGRHTEIERLYKGTSEDKKRLAEYNIQDCKLVYEILEKTNMVELSLERAGLTGMSLDKLSSPIASFDSLYLREARKKQLVSPSATFKTKRAKIKGGFVIQPNPGLYKNVLVFDFKSLYPSIIRTFNIDPSSQLKEKERDCIVTPNRAYFLNEEGILPKIIQRLYEAREKAKKEKRELSSHAIKVIMNSFFGVLASPNSRYFNFDMSNAITNFGQEIIKLTTKKIEEMGYKVIYGDTDSIFVCVEKTREELEGLGKEISFRINNFYKEYIEKNYFRKSYLVLEFEKIYFSLFIPKTRNIESDSERGAKKRYAGLIKKENEEAIEIVGLEAIRGDWTEAAQDFQKELLFRVFKEKNIIEFVKEFIKNLKSKKLDKKLIYRKSIRKDLQDYTKTTPPHIKAARKLEKIEGDRIEYYLTTKGPEPLQNLKNPIDYEHYIEKQIKPIADQILWLLDKDFQEIVEGNKQKKLFE